MTLTLEIAPEVEQALKVGAESTGQSVTHYTTVLLAWAATHAADVLQAVDAAAKDADRAAAPSTAAASGATSTT